jgi:uncharacterized membrane protein HdeD (DUF308 family)
MSIGSRLKIKSMSILVTSAFYAAAGVIFLVLLPAANSPPHVAIIGMLSLAAAYGLFRQRVWAIWLVVILFFVVTTYSAFVIYNVSATDFLLTISMIAYLILTWIFTAYAAAKRRSLES